MGPGSQVNIPSFMCMERQVILFSSRRILVTKMDDFWDMYTEKKVSKFPGENRSHFFTVYVQFPSCRLGPEALKKSGRV
jgi:hypothetical protein